jgi:hypothetical protein
LAAADFAALFAGVAGMYVPFSTREFINALERHEA